MSQPVLIDPLAFTSNREQQSGLFGAEALLRVAAVVQGIAEPFAWQVSGGTDRYQRPTLQLTLQGEVEVVCQRCLGSMRLPLQIRTAITLFADEEKLEDAELEDESIEGLVIERELDLLALIEDEILLALPYAPRHDVCALKVEPGAKVAAGKPNPFAVLAALKTKPSRDA